MAYRNKEKQKEYARNHYLKNKEKMIARAIESTKLVMIRNREYIKNYLSNNPCVDCGEKDVIVLEFDHISGKKLHNISEMVGKGSSIKTIDIEISKCEVRCANCHRRVTHNRRIQSIKTS